MLALPARETRRGPVSSGSPGHWRSTAVLTCLHQDEGRLDKLGWASASQRHCICPAGPVEPVQPAVWAPAVCPPGAVTGLPLPFVLSSLRLPHTSSPASGSPLVCPGISRSRLRGGAWGSGEGHLNPRPLIPNRTCSPLIAHGMSLDRTAEVLTKSACV